MWPYIIPVLATLLGVIFYDAQDVERNRKWLYWSVYVYIVFLFGLRYRIGGDTGHYMWYYSFFPSFSTLQHVDMEEFEFMQPGYKLIWLIMRSISPDFWPYQMVHGTIINFGVMYWITRNTKYWFTGLLIYLLCYCLYFNTEIMRESYAIVILMYIYKYIKEKKWIKYYIGVALAMMFHVSAAILILLPPISLLKLKIDTRFVIIMVVALIVLLVLKSQVMNLALSFGGMYGKKLLFYTSMLESGGLNNNWLYIRVVRFSVFPLLVAGVWKLVFKQPLRFEHMICLYIIMGAGVILFQEICVRFTNYMMPFFYMAITTIVGSGIRRVSRHKLVSYGLLVLTLTLTMYEFIRMDMIFHYYTPYRSVLTEETDKARESMSNF